MRSPLQITAAAAFLVADLSTTGVLAHPGCYTQDETPTLDVSLAFCEVESDGACCTPTQENDAIGVYNLYGPLTGQCALDYAKVACGPCSSYAGHLYERLGSELGVADGMTMKRDFCDGMVAACSGQISFPTYDGVDYCDKHVGGEEDLLWSYPIDPEETTFESSGLVKAFPNLDDDDDLPNDTIAMHMTPDGTKWWLAGQDGEIREVDSDNPSSSVQVVDVGEVSVFYRAFEEGLLDFAFDPYFDGDGDGNGNNLFYVSYTIDNNVGRINRLSKFEYFSGNSGGTLSSEEVVLESPPKATSIHSAGWCGFKPSDYGTSGSHDIYWAVGDGGPQEDTEGVGEDATSILASIVRISVSSASGYTIPSGNFEGEICAKGFRNPFRCGFDSADDTLYCGDVGHTKVEEIDIVECGNDYGWSRFEGSRCQEAQEDRIGNCATLSRSGLVFPIYEYCHPDYDSSTSSENEFTGGNDFCGARTVEGLAVIGGYPYRGQRFNEVLTGALLFADAQKKNLYYLVNEGNGVWVPGTIIGDGSTSIISFAEDNDGEQYVITSDRVPHQLPCGDLCAKTCLTQAETQPVYTSLGCFGDFSNNRALTLGSSAGCSDGEDLMSPAICSSYCATIEGSNTFGVEYAFECFCGGSSDDYDKHGSLDMEQCETLCTGTPDEFCGGTNAIEVYSFSDGVPQTPSPLGIVPPTGGNDDYVSVGCFADSVSNRVLSFLASRDAANTIEACAEKCTGSTYFGTEYGTECFCSVDNDDPAELGTATCGMACSGDKSQICGGKNAISVYEYVGVAPTPTVPSDVYVALGCYADLASPRVLSGPFKDTGSMTAEVCAVECLGSQYFGTQYGHECWCGAAGTDIDVNGPGTCDSPCAGDGSETCGGSFAFSAYEYTDVISPTPTAPTPTPSDVYVALGCYADLAIPRVLTALVKSEEMTVEFCAKLCVGNQYFGTQYGHECWCGAAGTDIDVNGPATCNVPCEGDPSETCGGSYAFSAYEYTDVTSPTPSASVIDLGCYEDSKSARIMGLQTSDKEMTVELCSEKCASIYFGVQYGVECWCSDTTSFKAIGTATNCDYDCGGDDSQNCGGYNAMHVYQNTG